MFVLGLLLFGFAMFALGIWSMFAYAEVMWGWEGEEGDAT